VVAALMLEPLDSAGLPRPVVGLGIDLRSLLLAPFGAALLLAQKLLAEPAPECWQPLARHPPQAQVQPLAKVAEILFGLFFCAGEPAPRRPYRRLAV
jgi:hypothetical protein